MFPKKNPSNVAVVARTRPFPLSGIVLKAGGTRRKEPHRVVGLAGPLKTEQPIHKNAHRTETITPRDFAGRSLVMDQFQKNASFGNKTWQNQRVLGSSIQFRV